MKMSASASPVLGCPDREMLIGFDLGRLSARDLDAVARHISSCSPCEQFLHALHGQPNEDNVIGRLNLRHNPEALAKFSGQAALKEAGRLLDRVRMPKSASRLSAYPQSLSGGMRPSRFMRAASDSPRT